MIDIQKESLVAAIPCRVSSRDITSLYYCEGSCILYVGRRDGEVESYIASTTSSGISQFELGCEPEIIEID